MDPQELQANSMSAKPPSRSLTSVITDRLYNHLEKEAIMTPEQRGGKKDCYGCRDHLMINNAILENCKKRKKNLSTA